MKVNKSAIIGIDLQRGFSTLCPNELPVNFDIEKVVGAFNRLIPMGDVMVGSKDCHPSNAIHIADKDHPQFSPIVNGGDNVDIYWNGHCIVGTEGNELLPGMPKVEDFNFFVYKGIQPNLHPYGFAYHDLNNRISTGVIEWLKINKVNQAIISGIAIDYCLKTSAIQLAQAGFYVMVCLEASAGIAKETINKAIDEMKSCGIIIYDTVEDVKKGILL
jgi:nicotinamidase/pyrazinamidase